MDGRDQDQPTGDVERSVCVELEIYDIPISPWIPFSILKPILPSRHCHRFDSIRLEWFGYIQCVDDYRPAESDLLGVPKCQGIGDLCSGHVEHGPKRKQVYLWQCVSIMSLLAGDTDLAIVPMRPGGYGNPVRCLSNLRDTPLRILSCFESQDLGLTLSPLANTWVVEMEKGTTEELFVYHQKLK